jgi:hypothetical protein
MRFLKQHLAAVMAGVVVLGGSAFVATQQLAASPGDTVTLAQNDSAPPSDAPNDAPNDGRKGPGGPRHHGPDFGHAIRGEIVVPEREGDGYVTARFDRGVLQRVDGSTLVIEEADGTSVEVPTDDETRVYRDGEDAELSDLQAGDHVATMRVKEGDAFVTKGVRAISPEQWEEGHERRDDRREHMRERFEERRDERGA